MAILINDTEFHQNLENFQNDYFSFIKSLSIADAISFSKQLFKLNQLYIDPIKNFNAIDEFFINTDFEFSYYKYYGILSKSYITKTREVTSVKLILFNKEFEQLGENGRLILKRTPEERMHDFIESVRIFIDINISVLKKSRSNESSSNDDSTFKSAFKNSKLYSYVIAELSKPEHGNIFDVQGHWIRKKRDNPKAAIVLVEILKTRGYFRNEIVLNNESKVDLIKNWFGVTIGKKSSTLKVYHETMTKQFSFIKNAKEF